jgi:hypothetical protein
MCDSSASAVRMNAASAVPFGMFQAPALSCLRAADRKVWLHDQPAQMLAGRATENDGLSKRSASQRSGDGQSLLGEVRLRTTERYSKLPCVPGVSNRVAGKGQMIPCGADKETRFRHGGILPAGCRWQKLLPIHAV